MLWEVSVEGSLVSYGEDEDGRAIPCLSEDTIAFIEEGRDLIEIMMLVQAKLDVLNGKLKQKYPDLYKDDLDWEYKIVGIGRTDLVRFDDRWIEEFVDKEVMTWNSNEEENS
jgi:hypothetical protein